jgi:hypothetical protein
MSLWTFKIVGFSASPTASLMILLEALKESVAGRSSGQEKSYMRLWMLSRYASGYNLLDVLLGGLIDTHFI